MEQKQAEEKVAAELRRVESEINKLPLPDVKATAETIFTPAPFVRPGINFDVTAPRVLPVMRAGSRARSFERSFERLNTEFLAHAFPVAAHHQLTRRLCIGRRLLARARTRQR